MKQNRIFLLALLVLVFLCSCTQTPPDQMSEKVQEKVRKATVRLIDNNSGSGTGFFVAPDMIVTNIHVVAGDESVSVTEADGTEYTIENIIGSDPAHDLVILQVSGKQKGTPLSLSNCRIGEPIFVTGYKDRKYKVTGGIVYGSNDKRIRHDAKTSPGRSGGPVLNIKGEVIGITVGSDGTNLSNAIPSNILKTLLEKPKSEQGQSWDEWQKEDSIRAYVYYKSGIKKGENNKYGEAIKDYTKAVESYRNFTDAYKNRGVARHRLGKSNRKNENVKKARNLYEEAIEDLNKSLDGAYDHYSLGRVKYDLGNLEAKDGNADKAIDNYQDAVCNYSTAIAIDKQNRDYPVLLEKAYFSRALAKIRLGDLKASKGNTEKAQSLYSEVLDDFAKAIELDSDNSADAFKLIPGNADGYYVKGGMELILGQSKAKQGGVAEARLHYQGAIADFSKAIERKSKFIAEAYWGRGLAYQKTGQHERAKSDFAEAKKLDPDIENK